MPSGHSPDPVPGISIVIVTYDGRSWLEPCLRALQSQGQTDLEIVLVDNASRDGTIEFVRHAFPDVRLIPLDTNRGFAGANNIGCRAARGRYLMLLNNDTVAAAGCVPALRFALETTPWADLAAARLVFLHDPDVVDSAGDGYTRWGGAFKRFHGRPSADAAEVAEVFGVCGAAFMIRREIFERIGGFDDDFFMVYEDVDFSYRAQLLGHRVVYVPTAVVRHAGSATLGRSSVAAVFHGQRNLEWAYAKNTPWPLLLRSLPGHLAYVVAAGIYFAMNGRFMAFLSGKWAAVKGLPAILRKRRQVQRTRRSTSSRLWSLMDRRWLALKVREKRFDRQVAGVR